MSGIKDALTVNKGVNEFMLKQNEYNLKNDENIKQMFSDINN